MRIEIFALCDAATVDHGKLNILGAFDSIWSANNLPVTHSQCAIALRIRFKKIERGEHSVKITFVDIDGKNVMPPLDSKLNINFTDQQSSGTANLIINLQGLKFEKFGEFSIDLAIDGEEKASLPVFVNKR